MRYAVILAGGSGVRLWPASRRSRPKQFLPLGAQPGESLLAATARRIAPLCPAERTMVVTAASQAEMVGAALPELPAGNVLAEPVARNTAAALGLAAVYVQHRDADGVMAALPADHHIADEARFAEIAGYAFAAAEAQDVIVTVGIVPTKPETGFGYLHVGERQGEHTEVVRRFVEKPDQATAQAYVASGAYLWNGGMFFVKARHLLRELAAYLPETYAGLEEIRAALTHGGEAAAARAAQSVYPRLPKISIDYGVMERATGVLTVRGDFGWNDVGSWSALAEYRPADDSGNITEGTVITHDAHGNIVLAEPGTAIAVIGVDNLVVVQSQSGILIVPRERAQEARQAVEALERRNLDEYL